MIKLLIKNIIFSFVGVGAVLIFLGYNAIQSYNFYLFIYLATLIVTIILELIYEDK